jgi:3-phenylpropionate/trans-cinnamate dioxygenase ferredoxin reductase component
MSRPRTMVLVGGGLAGAKAAETLREEGFDGPIVLRGAEREQPYERPPLSKEYLRGETGAAKPFVHDENFYEAHAWRSSAPAGSTARSRRRHAAWAST